MGETQRDLTAVTSEYGDERPERGLGVSIRRGGIEVEYIDATGIEEHAPMDWTPDMAQVLGLDLLPVPDGWALGGHQRPLCRRSDLGTTRREDRRPLTLARPSTCERAPGS